MWANMNYLIAWQWIGPMYPHWNHGARPRKGVNTCWQELWERLHDPLSKNIYEFDLTKFFDLVRLSKVEQALKITEMDPNYIKHIMDMMRLAKSNLTYSAKKLEWKELKTKYLEAAIDPLYSEADHRRAKAELKESDKTWYTSKSGKRRKVQTAQRADHGVPQGFSLSPLLACLTLAEEWNIQYDRLHRNTWMAKLLGLNPGIGTKDKMLMYMDDGLIFSDASLSEDTLLLRTLKATAREVGTRINLKKSSHLKSERFGGWHKKKFKFLGVEYIPGQDTLKAKTRNGATMEFPIADIMKVDLSGPSGQVFIRYLEAHTSVDSALKYGLFDAILSKMWDPNQGELKYVGDHIKIYHPLSFASYYENELDKLGSRTTKTNLSSKASAILNMFASTWTRKRAFKARQARESKRTREVPQESVK